jgi:hypothetical protein
MYRLVRPTHRTYLFGLPVALLAIVAGTLALPAGAASAGANVQRDPALLEPAPLCTVNPAKELFVTNLSVVEDCFRTTWTGICPVPVAPATRGAWTFGKLIQGVAGTTNATTLNAFVRRWLNHWNRDVTVNSDLVPQRPSIQSLVITPWETASGSTTLDMQKAPFRLLAIVFRFDLRDASGGYGGANTAGEGRFVFGVLDANGNPTSFTVIFEFGLDVSSCADIQAWAHSAHDLGSLPFGPDYNAALQSITDQFTTIGASPNKLNGSAINQVRSNEIALSFPWELREFQLREVTIVKQPVEEVAQSTSGFSIDGKAAAPPPSTTRIDLVQTTVAQTPALAHHKQQILADYINTNEAAILANTHTVPLVFQSTPFRGGATRHNAFDLGWDGPGAPCSSINNNEARFNFSLNTCSGCHGDDTGTSFLHVFPRSLGNESFLSAFLNGGSATDVCGLSHNFGDLERRRLDLCALLDETCTQIEAEEPANFVH